MFIIFAIVKKFKSGSGVGPGNVLDAGLFDSDKVTFLDFNHMYLIVFVIVLLVYNAIIAVSATDLADRN